MTAFEAYRTAAREGVKDAGGTPILIEDFPSMDASSRSACLDLVRSSDVYIVIIGDRPGSSPLGKPVVEEEFEEARRRKLARIMFLQDVARNAETQALADRLSDYVHGRFRSTFGTPAELRAAISSALKNLGGESAMHIERNDPSAVGSMLTAGRDSQETLLRIAVLPERHDDVFDVLQMDDAGFRRSLMRIAHDDDVRLFDFEQGEKSATVEDNELILTQEPTRGRTPGIHVTVRLREDGGITIDQTISGRHRDGHNFGLDIQIAESDISEAISSSIAFVQALYEQHDPGHRYATFYYGAAVAGMSMHVVVRQLRHQQSWSLPMDDRGWIVLDKPRKIDRTDLANPKEIIQRMLALIGKRYGERK